MKLEICKSIVDYISSVNKPRYYIHFDKMIFNIGWFIGFVAVWKGKRPHEGCVQQIPFVVHVTDWGGFAICKKRPAYRVAYSRVRGY
jgi:hypothetical protein